MHKLLIPAFLIVLLAFTAVPGCGTTEKGPKIFVGLNVRNLCNYNVSVDDEARCLSDADCTAGQFDFCWFSPESPFNSEKDACQIDGDCKVERCNNSFCQRICSTDDDCDGTDSCTGGFCGSEAVSCQDDGECREERCHNGWCHLTCGTSVDCDGDDFCTGGFCRNHMGFCRQCRDDAACSGASDRCDHGRCHTTCTVDDDCAAAGGFCTKNFCRKAHFEGTEFNFCNRGNKDLEVYLDQVVLHGNDDACVFSRFEWSTAEAKVVLAPDDCSLFLNVKFTPPDVGEFRGFLNIPSNSIRDNPLLILMCGQAVESVCSVSEDLICPECASCLEEDFAQIIADEPEPDCTSYF